MIFIMTDKALKKNLNALIYPKPYLIVDGMDDESAELSRKYSNTITMSSFNPPSKCVKARLDDDEDGFYGDYVLDDDKIDKIEKRWKNSPNMEKDITALVDTFITKDQINIFIIMRKKAYKAFSESVKKKITSMFTDNSTERIKFVYTFDEYQDDHKSLKRDLKDKDIETIKRSVDAQRELIKKNEERDEEERKKKGKRNRRRYEDD